MEPRPGKLVRTIDGRIGRTYSNNDSRADGKVIVHLPDPTNPIKYGYPVEAVYEQNEITVIGIII